MRVRRVSQQSRKPSRNRQHAILSVEQLEERSLLDAAALSSLDALAVDSSQYRPDRILVQFRDSNTEALPGTNLGHSIDMVAGLQEVWLGAGMDVGKALAAYRADPRVLHAQPDYVVSISGVRMPNDTQMSSLWGLHNTGQSGGTVDADIDAPEAWDVTTGSGRVIVAVIDTGVDYNHPDLVGNIWINRAEIPGNGIDDDRNGYVDDIHGYDFVNNDGNPMDDNGHGTHVAGTIGAHGDNGRGVVGVNWRVQIMALKFLNAQGSGYLSDALKALNYAVANGASISNNSWGGGGYDGAMFNALQAARNAGHIFVAAAGNEGRNNDTTASYPANYAVDNVVSVAALDRNNRLASFSNYGQRTVDLGAPGVSILSTVPGNRYATYSGTSMAAPHVTGVMALVRDLHPTWTYRQVIDQVLNTVDPVAALQNRTVTGGGVNAARAVGPASGSQSGPRVVSSQVHTRSGGAAYCLRVSFADAIDPTSFTTADIVSFTGPNGAIAVSGVTPVAGSADKEFDITFASQTRTGSYRLTLGPNISDNSGNLMNQDGDGRNGEATEDRYTGTFVVRRLATYSSSDVGKSILDNSRTVSSIIIGHDLVVRDLNVTLNLTHTYDGDLNIYLAAPGGRTVLLVAHRGADGDDFVNTVLDDEAATHIADGLAPFQGSFRPERLLSRFDGLNARGRWRLWVDDLADGDTGVLNGWSLTIGTNSGRASSVARSAQARATASDTQTEAGLVLLGGSEAVPTPASPVKAIAATTGPESAEDASSPARTEAAAADRIFGVGSHENDERSSQARSRASAHSDLDLEALLSFPG